MFNRFVLNFDIQWRLPLVGSHRISFYKFILCPILFTLEAIFMTKWLSLLLWSLKCYYTFKYESERKLWSFCQILFFVKHYWHVKFCRCFWQTLPFLTNLMFLMKPYRFIVVKYYNILSYTNIFCRIIPFLTDCFSQTLSYFCQNLSFLLNLLVIIKHYHYFVKFYVFSQVILFFVNPDRLFCRTLLEILRLI